MDTGKSKIIEVDSRSSRGSTVSYQVAPLLPTSKYYQPHKSSGEISQVLVRQEESGADSQTGVKHWKPVSCVQSLRVGGHQLVSF